MAPVPAASSNFNVVISSQPSSTYSCSVFYSNLNPPPTTDPVEAATVQTADWEAPSIAPAPLTPSQLPLSTELEQKPLVPETETLLEISDPEATDEFVEFVSQSQRWDNHRKRPVQDQGRPATAMDRAPVGEYRSSHFQEFLMAVSIHLIAIFLSAAITLAINRIARKLCCGPASSGGCELWKYQLWSISGPSVSSKFGKLLFEVEG
ncbi:hypothetical protein B9Z19DRAFT_1121624 [Tuber borchii]|uniref:Uncharacterized protein n=1 Tax=Tuber borchii TaxID=42251 RepID=A0A2T7A294_TUBBO|nr:hypothetical protein B9Z19DRAFT_1121624 [Tuber borchii]